jgi:hypothetical protein
MVVIDTGIRMAGSCLFNCDPNKTKVVVALAQDKQHCTRWKKNSYPLPSAVVCDCRSALLGSQGQSGRRGSNVSCRSTNHNLLQDSWDVRTKRPNPELLRHWSVGWHALLFVIKTAGVISSKVDDDLVTIMRRTPFFVLCVTRSLTH